MILAVFFASIVVDAKTAGGDARDSASKPKLKFMDIKKDLLDQKKLIINDYKTKGNMRPIAFRGYHSGIGILLQNESLEKETKVSREWFKSLQSSYIKMYRIKEVIFDYIRLKNKKGLDSAYDSYKKAIIEYQAILAKPIKAKKE